MNVGLKVSQYSGCSCYLGLKTLEGKLLLNRDTNGKVTTQLYDKQDDFNFSLVNFPYICKNIPSSLAYGVYTYVSQLIRYARACCA